MTDHRDLVLAATEGATADIAWIVVSVLCWFFMIAPFVIWYCGVRTPRAERRAAAAEPDTTPTTTELDDRADDGARKLTA